mmetsp:Transcript_33833/g.105074  ORF Transcript_33833/g.105074 Transcript_33833/m.105074 type:complete len:153 (+) Transcript_33833:98-556(+)
MNRTVFCIIVSLLARCASANTGRYGRNSGACEGQADQGVMLIQANTSRRAHHVQHEDAHHAHFHNTHMAHFKHGSSVAGYVCSLCSHKYDPDTDGGGKAFDELPDTWTCPVCGAPKRLFQLDDNTRIKKPPSSAHALRSWLWLALAPAGMMH